jgi:hypothetical protein
VGLCLALTISFTCLRAISNAPEEFRQRILRQFKIPKILFTRVCLQLNGFCGCENTFDRDKNIEGHSRYTSCLSLNHS